VARAAVAIRTNVTAAHSPQFEGRQVTPISEYARAADSQSLDPHGRSPPVHKSNDEVLEIHEIPAFLRRRAV
jgi:hypothetical protein